MISDYVEGTDLLERMRAGSVGPHIDGFASSLTEAGHSPHTIRGYLRAAVHVGGFARRHRIQIASFDDEILVRFRLHLSHCTCERNKGVFDHTISAVRRLLMYLRAKEVTLARDVLGELLALPVDACAARRDARLRVDGRPRALDVQVTAVGHELALDAVELAVGDDAPVAVLLNEAEANHGTFLDATGRPHAGRRATALTD